MIFISINYNLYSHTYIKRMTRFLSLTNSVSDTISKRFSMRLTLTGKVCWCAVPFTVPSQKLILNAQQIRISSMSETKRVKMFSKLKLFSRTKTVEKKVGISLFDSTFLWVSVYFSHIFLKYLGKKCFIPHFWRPFSAIEFLPSNSIFSRDCFFLFIFPSRIWILEFCANNVVNHSSEFGIRMLCLLIFGFVSLA